MAKVTEARGYLLAILTEWKYDFLSMPVFAEYHGLTVEEAQEFILLARKVASHAHPDE